MARSDLQELATFAETLADASRSVLAPAIGQFHDVEVKGDATLVTQIDREIEARLREMIAKRFPSHGMVGEEWGTANREAEFVWVIDPIDGTGQFVAGVPVYGTLIGLAQGGRPVVGVADHPATDDRWVGVAGVGTTRNGKAVRVRRCGELARAMLSTSSPDFYKPAEWERFRALRREVRWAVYGASCYAYALLASGRVDLAVDCGLDIFDLAALVAIIEGAGGTVTDWRGQPITLAWAGSIVAAGDPEVHERALAILAGRQP